MSSGVRGTHREPNAMAANELLGLCTNCLGDLENSRSGRQAYISDAGLAHLKGLAGLKDLHRFRAQVTDAGLKEVQQALSHSWIEDCSGRRAGGVFGQF